MKIYLVFAAVLAAIAYYSISNLSLAHAQQQPPAAPPPTSELSSTTDITPTGIGSTVPTSQPTVIPSPTPDTTAPSVQITNPANGSRVTRNSTVTITASASDSSGINRVEFYVNSALLCTDTTAPYTCQWAVPKKPQVQYSIRATAFDAHQNSGSHTVSVTSR